MASPAVTTQKTEIDPRLAGPSGDIINALMESASVNPWDKEYTGPRMAAMNEQQMQGMDAAAGRGRALGFGFDSARGSLPQAQTIGGMQTYDPLSMARSGMSPQMQALYGSIFGENGAMGRYRDGGQVAPVAAAPQAGGGGGGGRSGGGGGGSRYEGPTRPRSREDGGGGGTFSGGGADGVGNFGSVGDYFGGIGDAIGVTDYAGQKR